MILRSLTHSIFACRHGAHRVQRDPAPRESVPSVRGVLRTELRYE